MIFNNNYAGFFKRNRVSKAGRPAIRPEMSPIDWLLEAIALLGLMVFAGFVVYQFPKLPETLPSHFNGAGSPDEYSSRSSFWILPGVGIFIYILLSLIVLIPYQFNYMVRITPENALRQYTMATRLIRYLKSVIILLFLYISHATVQVAEGKSPGLGFWFLPVVLGAIFGSVIIYFIASSRNR